MSIKQIIAILIEMISMITGKIEEMKKALEEKIKECKKAYDQYIAAETAMYETKIPGLNYNHIRSLKSDIAHWQSETLQQLIKTFFASETFCRKTLGEIKRLTKLAEDQENSRKGNPRLAAAYRSKVEQIRSERSRALEVLERKEAKVNARKASAAEAKEKAEAVAKIQFELDQYIAEHKDQIELYESLVKAKDEAEAAYLAAYEIKEAASRELAREREGLRTLTNLKEEAERSLRAEDSVKDDWDLEEVIEWQKNIQKRFSRYDLENQYLKMIA